MRFMKKHKLTTFIIIIYIAIIIVLYFLYKIFMGSNGLPVYGDRLDGIENVPITNEQKTKLVNDLKANSDVIKVSEPHLSGRTYNVVIYVTDVDKVDNAKKLADVVTKSLDDKQNEFYDVQVFITKKYACTLEATGVVDEDGNFTSDVKVKFKDDLASDKTELQGVDSQLLNAIGGTLRNVLAVKESLDFDNTAFLDLGTLSWAYSSREQLFLVQTPPSSLMFYYKITSQYRNLHYLLVLYILPLHKDPVPVRLQPSSP